MNFCSPGRGARERPLVAGREASAAAAADGCLLDLLEQALRRVRGERLRQSRPVAGPREHALWEQAHPLGLDRRAARLREHALDDALAGVDQIAVAHGRRGVAEAQADGLAERDRSVLAALAELEPERRTQRVHVLGAGRGEAGGARADAHVATPARDQQIVVEARDAVDGSLRQARERRGGAAVIVGDLAVILERRLEHVERGRGVANVGAPDQLDEVAGHAWQYRTVRSL